MAMMNADEVLNHRRLPNEESNEHRENKIANENQSYSIIPEPKFLDGVYLAKNRPGNNPSLDKHFKAAIQ